MPHDASEQTHWHEPKAGENAGYGAFKRPEYPYDRFMESEGVPIHRAIGVHRVQDLPMAPWARLGGRGTYIQLYGTEGLWGIYVVEVPSGGALAIERHLFEKTVLVIAGRGSTEVWQGGQTKRQTFEWQTGSLFSIPLNAFHRFVNATNSPALLLCGTSAPNMFNLLHSAKFIFDCPYNFDDRYAGADDFFKPKDDIEPDRVRGLAMRRTNFIADIVNCELPLDNRRSPGFRRIEPEFTGSDFYLWIGQHETGRYSKAHKHDSSAVLICLKGKGYTYTWPDRLGTMPWQNGKSGEVFRQDYEFGGMVSAAPMSGDWFHQHFGISKEALRLSAWFGVGNHPHRKPGRPGETMTDFGAIDLKKGGTAIPYHEEDPFIRQEFEQALAREGVPLRMQPEYYETPAGYPD
jgi:quercetin dioxygenase-like cupin family protein